MTHKAEFAVGGNSEPLDLIYLWQMFAPRLKVLLQAVIQVAATQQVDCNDLDYELQNEC